MPSFIALLFIGLLAGWLSSKIMKGKGSGLIFNLIIGVFGAYIGGAVFNWLNISLGNGFIGLLITATIGSIILIFIARLISRK